MTTFQLLMLGASAFFAFKIFEHIKTLQDPGNQGDEFEQNNAESTDVPSPFSPQALVKNADKAFKKNDFQKALTLLHEADAKEPNNSEILFKTAYILQQTSDDEEALKYYKLALKEDEENEYIHNSMASIYRKNGEFTSAKMHLLASLDIDDSNPVTYYNFGNLLVDMQQPEEAKEMYQKALDLNPDFTEAKEELEKL